ncbi:MAG: hypothetical protein ACYDFT_03615 [Thermoplasmata archaeon]
MAPICINCSGTEFVWAGELKTGGRFASGPLALRAGGELPLGTRICRSCGHAELFLRDVTVLQSPHHWRPGEFIPISAPAASAHGHHRTHAPHEPAPPIVPIHPTPTVPAPAPIGPEPSAPPAAAAAFGAEPASSRSAPSPNGASERPETPPPPPDRAETPPPTPSKDPEGGVPVEIGTVPQAEEKPAATPRKRPGRPRSSRAAKATGESPAKQPPAD